MIIEGYMCMPFISIPFWIPATRLSQGFREGKIKWTQGEKSNDSLDLFRKPPYPWQLCGLYF